MTNGEGSEPVKLSALDVNVGSVDDQVKLGDLELRKEVARKVVALFILANLFVLAFLGIIFAYDVILIRHGFIMPGDRLITSELLMTLVGATAVQVGTIMVSISIYLFPKPASAGGAA